MRSAGARLAALLAVPLALAAAPPPTRQQLRDAEALRGRQIEAEHAAAARAATAREQEATLGRQRAEAAAKLAGVEDATAAAASRIADLAARRAAAQQHLDASAAAMGPLLPLIERLSLYPAETLLAVPQPPEQAIRGLLVLGGITRELEARASALRREQAQVAALQAQIDAGLPALATARAAQQTEEAALDEQISNTAAVRRAAEGAGAEAARQAARAAGQAASIRSALARIEADRRAAEARAQAEAAAERQRDAARAEADHARALALAEPAGAGLGAAHGGLAAPVSGTVQRGFGDATAAGPASGITYLAAPEARIVSPCGGRVVFAGPFRSFGLLMILDCGGGYHFVLAGFARIDARIGQAVQPGEPVGVMPNWDPRSSASRPSLYVELRQNGQAVNPAPFLRGRG